MCFSYYISFSFLFFLNVDWCSVWLWILSIESSDNIRRKKMNDFNFQTKLLYWMINLICEKMFEVMMNETHEELEFQVFQFYFAFDHLAFDEMKNLYIYDIVCSHQMHNEKHTLTCFKYDRKECWMQYLRNLMQVTMMNLIMSIIWLERDHYWLNAYNSWLILMIRANHNVQILLMKDHVFAVIFYILKYVCKLKKTLHSKLIIMIAHHSTFISISLINTLNSRQMILQIYNKIESHQEIKVFEMISHLLDYFDHYLNMTFENINIAQLWLYITQLQKTQKHIDDDHLHFQIINIHKDLTLLSFFNDYRFRENALIQYSLYDYHFVIYKRRLRNDLSFSVDYSQHNTHIQLYKQIISVTLCLIKVFFHFRRNSFDSKVHEKFFCILIAFFVLWYNDVSLWRSMNSWKDHFQVRFSLLSLRIRRHIFNIDLLYRSKKESEFNWMQWETYQTSSVSLNFMLNSNDDDDENDDDTVLLSLIKMMNDVLTLKLDVIDFYTH